MASLHPPFPFQFLQFIIELHVFILITPNMIHYHAEQPAQTTLRRTESIILIPNMT